MFVKEILLVNKGSRDMMDPKFSMHCPGRLNVKKCPVDKFKGSLNTFLRAVPGEPPVPGHTGNGRAPTNSTPDQVAPSQFWLRGVLAWLGSHWGCPIWLAHQSL